MTEWQPGDRAIYRGIEVLVVRLTEHRITVQLPGKGLRSVQARSLTKALEPQEAQ